jgi:hypothetical protein
MLAVPTSAAGVYRRLAGLCDDIAVEVTDDIHPADAFGSFGGTWWSTAELATRPEALRAAVDGEAARILTEYGHTARRHVAASRVLHDYLWTVGLLFAGPWHLERRVPLLRPERLWFETVGAGFAVAPDGFASPEGEAASPDLLRTAFGEFVEPVLTAFRPEIRRGPHALRGMAADDLVSALGYFGRVLGQEEQAVRESAALVPDGPRFRTLRGPSGRSYPVRTRTGCCLFYAIRPAEACLTCPRVNDQERLRQLEAEAEAQARAQAQAQTTG